MGKRLENSRKRNEKSQYIKIARDIKNKIKELNTHRSKNVKRIIWELVQNAKDSKKNGDLSIEIFLTEEYFEFRHDGDPFNTDNLNGLIFQKTTKEQNDEKIERGEEIDENGTTGKYGTGFIVSYFISKLFEVKGIFIDEDKNFQRFSLKMDRTFNNNKELAESIKNSWINVYDDLDDEEKSPITKDYSDFGKGCHTSFKYFFQDQDGFNNAISTLKDLDLTLPYVFSFIKKLKKITIHNEIEEKTTIYTQKESRKFKKNSNLIKIEKNTNGEIEFKYILRITSKKVRLAKELLSKNHDFNDDNDFYMCSKDTNLPTFFVDFPLIGSEKYKFPFVIQSHLLEPMDCRSDIFLDDINLEAQFNKKLLLNVFRLYKYIFLDLEHLEGFDALVDMDFKNSWFRNNVEIPIGNLLKNKEIIPVCNKSKKTSFNELICYNDYEMNQIMENFGKDTILTNTKKDHRFWKDILKRYWFNYEFKNIRDIIKKVSSLTNLESLMNYFNSESEAFNFLNKLYKLVHFNTLKEEKIFPNKKGEFKKFKQVKQFNFEEESLLYEDILFEEENIPLYLKEIVLKYCNYDIDEILIHEDVEVIENNWRMEKKSTKDLIEKINEKFEKGDDKDLVFELSKLMIKGNNERDNIFELGEIFYKFEKKEIDFDLPDCLWKKSDEYFIKHLIEDSKNLINMELLNNKTGDNNLSAVFLRNFHFVLQQYNKLEYSRFPNIENNLFPIKDLSKFDIETGLRFGFEENEYPGDIYDILLKILRLIDKKQTEKFINSKFLEYASGTFSLQNSFDMINNFILKNKETLEDNPNNKMIIKELLKLERYNKLLKKIPYFYENKDNLILTGILSEEEKKDIINLMKDETGVEIMKNYQLLNREERRQYSNINREDLKLLRKIKNGDYAHIFENNNLTKKFDLLKNFDDEEIERIIIKNNKE